MSDITVFDLSFLIDPIRFAFMQRAFFATVVVGAACATIGTFVVLKGLAFIGDALAHASFVGVAAAYLLGTSVYLGAAVAAVGTSVAIALVVRRSRVSFDTAIGVLFAGAFSLGIVLMSRVRNYTVDLFSFVFGNVLGIGPDDMVLIVVLGGLVAAIVTIFYKELLFVAFDPVTAEASGVPAATMHYLLLALLGLTTVLAMKALGIVLVVAMLVTPAATASLLSRRFQRVMWLGIAIGVASSIIGLYLSYYAEVPSGAAIVLVSTGFFVLAFFFSPSGGLFVRRRSTEMGRPGPEAGKKVSMQA